MQNDSSNVALLFETSWEVCNKIGGIYTVLSTKAKTLQSIYKDKVIFIGPDLWNEKNPSPYFKEYKTLLRNASTKLDLPYGISIRVGRWKIPGSPIVVLVKFDGIYQELNNFYGQIWEAYKVDSLHAYGDYDESCAFGIASSIVVTALTNHLKIDPLKVLSHFNEWTTGMGLLHLKLSTPEIATIFTTHATSIGRSICGNGKPLYDYLKGYNGDQMAYELNMVSKHSLEKATAHNADCFTTVSNVTAIECEQLLEIYPHIVTPNGFEQNFVPVGSDYDKKRQESRKKLIDIAKKITGKDFSDDSFIIAISGRNEYRNKGIDLYIDAINNLNDKLISENRNIIAFIMVPAWVNEPSEILLKNLIEDKNDSLDCNFMTHSLNYADSDSIYSRLRDLNPNSHTNKTSVIYIPCYLDGNDGILNLTYYDMMPGLDATIFPSYYEPWGYTPLESIAFGVPTITSDKAGFGQWILSSFNNDFNECGTKVINRTDSNYHEAKEQISNGIIELLKLGKLEIENVRSKAISTSKQADWSKFIEYYIESFNVAISRRDNRTK